MHPYFKFINATLGELTEPSERLTVRVFPRVSVSNCSFEPPKEISVVISFFFSCYSDSVRNGKDIIQEKMLLEMNKMHVRSIP